MTRPVVDGLPRRAATVTLRRLRLTDLADFQAYRHDAELGRYQRWLPMSDAAATDFLTQMHAAPRFVPGVWSQIAIADPVTDALLGDIGVCLAPDGQSAEIGFTLARHAQGRGLATLAVGEAIRMVFEGTAAARLIGVSDARNAASIRLLERVGMRRVGEALAVFRGEACVEVTYALERQGG